MVAALGETTAGPSLPRLRDIMLESSEGRKILKDRPRVNSQTIDMGELAQYPEGSFGRAYVTWLERCGVTPDTREPVRRSHLNFVIALNCPCEQGTLHRRSRTSICDAALPRMSRLLPLYLFPPCKRRVGACPQILRIREPRSSRGSTISGLRPPSSRYEEKKQAVF